MCPYLAFGAPLAVPRRQNDRAESVDGDTEDGVDWAEADSVVEWQPQIAEQLAEHPSLSRQQVHRVERHGDRPNDKVADGQRRDEIVGRLTQRTLQEERQQDDQVAADCRQTDAARYQPYDHRQPHRPPTGINVPASRRRADDHDCVTSGHVVRRPRDLWRHARSIVHGGVSRLANLLFPRTKSAQSLKTRWLL